MEDGRAVGNPPDRFAEDPVKLLSRHHKVIPNQKPPELATGWASATTQNAIVIGRSDGSFVLVELFIANLLQLTHTDLR